MQLGADALPVGTSMGSPNPPGMPWLLLLTFSLGLLDTSPAYLRINEGPVIYLDTQTMKGCF